jgi:purine-binding chemotaxis protein CheW
MTSDVATGDHEFLTFELGSEEYGVDILCVQEIRVWSAVTQIPDTPKYLKGVINLRGVIVPIIDLRLRFKYSAKDYNETTVVIVLKQIITGKSTMVGVVVDAVSDVYKVSPQEQKESPNFGSHIDSRFIKGMATISEKIIILLKSEKLLDVENLFVKDHDFEQKVS